MPYSKVEGVDIGNLSADEAEKKLTDTVRAEYIDLIGRNGRERLDLTGTDAMISFSSLSDAIKMQNSTEWFRYYIDRAAENDISVSVSCDEAALDSAMNGLSMLNPANVTVPHDAYIAVNEDTGLYEVVAEVEGNEIKRKALKKAITDALSKGERKLNLEKADVYFEPVVRADDEDLSKDLWRMSSDYPAKKLMQSARGVSRAWCREAVQRCQVLDRRMKSGRSADSEGALKLFLMELAGAQ